MKTPKFRDEVQVFQIPYGEPEWFQFRTTGIAGYAGGIGASESGKLLGMDHHSPCLPELFAHKIGYEVPKEWSNIAVEKGKALEPLVKEVWCYWKGNAEEENIEALKSYNRSQKDSGVQKIRTYSDFGHYLVNPKYPFLFCSLDGVIDDGNPTCDGEILEFAAPLEAKTISYWAAQQWEHRIPPKYGVQVDQQMCITGSVYAELVMWEDGVVRVYKFYANQNSRAMLLETAYQFWQRVLKARELHRQISQYGGDINAQNQIWGEIQKLEPAPDGSEAYMKYMRERNNGVDVVKGKPRHYRYALGYKKVHALENVIKEIKQMYRNQIYKDLRDENALGFDFGKEGKVSQGKTFTVTVKPTPDEQQIKKMALELISKL